MRQGQNPGPDGFTGKAIVWAPVSFSLVYPLSSWSQTVWHVPAIINAVEAGQREEKIILKHVSEKLHEKLSLLCSIGSAGIQPV